ncbi:flagellar hook-associated protein FlgL [Pseudomonadota bacterium AL_CKDN230030165-1A_HGKHYDSX7]
MRLSTSLIYQTGLNGILNQEAALSRLQEQLSSGKRVLTPADDPLAASLAVNVSQTAAMNKTYDGNRATARQSLGMEDNALTSVVTTLQDVLKRVVEAGNGTMSDADRQALVSALESSRDQIMGLANSTDGNGQYLFSGYQGQTQPYTKDAAGNVTYQGDTGQRTIQVDQSRQLASSDIGSDIFASVSSGTRAYITKADPANAGTGQFSAVSINGPVDPAKSYSIEFGDDGAGNMVYSVISTPPDATLPTDVPYVDGDTIAFDSVSFRISGEPEFGDAFTVEPPNGTNMDMFASMNDLITALKNPSQGDPVATSKLVNQIATTNKQLTLSLDNVLTVRASVGARMNELDALDATGDARTLSYTAQLSGLEDVNIYEATTELLLRKVALDAASSAFSRIEGSSLFSRGR